MRRLIEKASVVFKDIDCGDKFEVLKTRDGQLTLGGKYSRDLVEFYAKTNDNVVVLGYGEELPEEEEPLKVGDYAKVVEFINDNRNYTKFTEIGDVVKIDRLDGGGRVDYTILRNGKQGSVVAYYKFTKATDEEVVGVNRKQAEDERWSSIGRKPGKFKKGDIVKGRSNLGSGEVIIGENKGLVDSNGHFAIASSNDDGYRIVRDIELITPVEARFDR